MDDNLTVSYWGIRSKDVGGRFEEVADGEGGNFSGSVPLDREGKSDVLALTCIHVKDG